MVMKVRHGLQHLEVPSRLQLTFGYEFDQRLANLRLRSGLWQLARGCESAWSVEFEAA